MTTLSTDLGATLLEIARSALEDAVYGRQSEREDLEGELREPRATFVTLTRQGQLRGCIGSLEPYRTLGEDVRGNARAAALHDSRFSPVQAGELDEISVEVSVLSSLERIEFRDEADLLAQLRPEVEGLVIACEGHRATFLPQVWQSLPRPEDFLGALKVKAGLDRSYWSEDMRAWRFTVEKYREETA